MFRGFGSFSGIILIADLTKKIFNKNKSLHVQIQNKNHYIKYKLKFRLKVKINNKKCTRKEGNGLQFK